MKRLFTTFALLIIIILGIKAQCTKLLDFTGTTNGSNPGGSLLYDGTYLYGMTYRGGANNYGTVFKIMPDGTGYLKLLDFDGTTNGSNPYGSLFSDGTYLYGMTRYGGANDLGALFKIMPDGTGYMKLLDFAGTTNGSYPTGSFISDGTYLYGMTHDGGTYNNGTIFKIKPDGSGYLKLLDFEVSTSGKYPTGSLIFDSTYLYGMTYYGGANGYGTVCKIKSDGSGYAKLLDFNGTNGSGPNGSLFSDSTYLYGMTQMGGANNDGIIFKIKPDGSGYVNLLDFAGTTNGSNPLGDLISDGTYLYGMTYGGGVNTLGVLFQIKPDGSNYTKLLDFGGVTNGSYPNGSLVSDGVSFYGMTFSGGTNSNGVIFKYGMVTGEEEINENNCTAIYPNPVDDILTIKNETISKDAIISIYNIEGLLLSRQTLKQSKTTIDISSLAKGIYILKLNSNNKTEVTKFIKE
jgi:uncharacterized repeat protein (TIGR03803 family)